MNAVTKTMEHVPQSDKNPKHIYKVRTFQWQIIHKDKKNNNQQGKFLTPQKHNLKTGCAQFLSFTNCCSRKIGKIWKTLLSVVSQSMASEHYKHLFKRNKHWHFSRCSNRNASLLNVPHSCLNAPQKANAKWVAFLIYSCPPAYIFF